jgi:hypothetical protein
MFKVNLTFTFTPDLEKFIRPLPALIANVLPIQKLCLRNELNGDNLLLRHKLADFYSWDTKAKKDQKFIRK